MSREKRTQRVTFKIGKRKYVITRDLPPEPVSELAPKSIGGMTRVGMLDIDDPAIKKMSASTLRTRMASGDYASNVRKWGTFPLHKMEPERTTIVAKPHGRTNLSQNTRKVSVAITFDMEWGNHSADAVVAGINRTLNIIAYSSAIKIASISVDSQQLLVTYHIDAGWNTPAGKLRDVEETFCHAVTHHGLVRAVTPLVVANSEFAVVWRMPYYGIGSYRLSDTYRKGAYVNNVKMLRDAFTPSDTVTVKKLRDIIFTTRKGDPCPLFKSGTQKKTRNAFFVEFLRQLWRAHIVDEPARKPLTTNIAILEGDTWTLTPYGRRVLDDLKSNPSDSPVAYYNL